MADVTFEDLPGHEVVEEGLASLAAGVESAAALAVASFSTRLRALDIPVPTTSVPDPGHALFALLARTNADDAHARYNALIQRLVSFADAAECASWRQPNA